LRVVARHTVPLLVPTFDGLHQYGVKLVNGLDVALAEHCLEGPNDVVVHRSFDLVEL
jgi:hypothetical protein